MLCGVEEWGWWDDPLSAGQRGSYVTNEEKAVCVCVCCPT